MAHIGVTAPVLELAGVGHAYGACTVLSGIDLHLPAGRIHALVGPSGCGKTTLLHLVAGLLPLQDGAIRNGFARSACMFQQPRLLPWKSALDNIALGLKARGVPRAARHAQARDQARRFGLDDTALAQYPQQLSGGMQSRVALARALVLSPDLLLLDEAFSALDVGLKAELYRQLLAEQARRPMAVLMITHDLMEAVRLAHAVWVMAPEPGRIATGFRFDDAPAQRTDAQVYARTAGLLDDATVRASFGLDAPAPAAPLALAAVGGLRC
ncbi:MAG: ATP-binding cassette domain-containing protein [Proteobacteria bacterium]|nr:MAG: ATP-binding cassette domain-containing protein [Pseudomonadota bacterium]